MLIHIVFLIKFQFAADSKRSFKLVSTEVQRMSSHLQNCEIARFATAPAFVS